MGENGWVTDHDEADRPAADQPQEPDDTEPTEPLSVGRWHDPVGAPSWVPPVTQPPPGQWDAPYGAPQYGAIPPPQTRPYPSFGQPPPPPPPRGRVPGWTWPVVCVLALVLGLVGGAFGSLLLERLTDDTPGLVSGGLDDVDTVTAAPLPDDNGSVAAVAQQLLPSTVQISAEYQGQKGGATGSGFVLDRQGHIITNNHVVADAAKDDGPIEIVDQDGNRYEARSSGAARSTTSPCSTPRTPATCGPHRSATRGRCTSVTRSSPSGHRSA